MIFMLAVTGFFTVMIFILIFIFAMKFRRARNPIATQIEGSNALEAIWTLIPFGIFMVMFVWGASHLHDLGATAAGRGGDLRRRQAVDVEVPAPRGTARDRPTARAAGTRHPADDDFPGRDPQPVPARVPGQAGRAAGTLHHHLVPDDEAGPLSPVLHAILRHHARGHDRRGGGDGTGSVPGVAVGRERGRVAGLDRAEAVPAARLYHLPPLRHPGPRAQPGRRCTASRCCWTTGAR